MSEPVQSQAQEANVALLRLRGFLPQREEDVLATIDFGAEASAAADVAAIYAQTSSAVGVDERANALLDGPDLQLVGAEVNNLVGEAQLDVVRSLKDNFVAYPKVVQASAQAATIVAGTPVLPGEAGSYMLPSTSAPYTWETVRLPAIGGLAAAA